MILEARSPSCFSEVYVLKLNGHPHGEYRGRFFSEETDIRLTNRRLLRLQKIDFWGSKFELTDTRKHTLLAEAQRAGALTSAWNLQLRVGSAEMISAGVFNTAYQVLQGSLRLATVDRVGLCEGGWLVKAAKQLAESDLIFIGLIYHTILRRNAAVAASAGAGS